MSPFNLQTCARPNILSLEPYSSARYQHKIDGNKIFLDANENAFGPSISPELIGSIFKSENREAEALQLARYPDPEQSDLKQHFCNLRIDHSCTSKTITPENVYVGAGASDVIDIIIRCFGVPGKDKILICPPTYDMYSVSAHINDVGIVKIPLLSALRFDLDAESINNALSQESNIKLVCLVSPNNPTGTVIAMEDVRKILQHPTWNGIVVIDEAYIDYSSSSTSRAEWVAEWPNLIVVQTLSKAFGMAGIRLGAAFSSPPVVRLLNNLSATYNIPQPTSTLACYALSTGLETMRTNKAKMEQQRTRLLRELPKLPRVGRLRGAAESNFLLFEFLDNNGKPDNWTASLLCDIMAEEAGVVLRFRGKAYGCIGCIRITVGTEAEVTQLLVAFERSLKNIEDKGIQSY